MISKYEGLKERYFRLQENGSTEKQALPQETKGTNFHAHSQGALASWLQADHR
jgi:hypothetical protein